MNDADMVQADASGFADGWHGTQRVLPAHWTYPQAEAYDRGHERGVQARCEWEDSRR